MSEKLTWWGYIHINGGVQAKRYWDKRDLDDAYESDLVRWVHGPFEATGREDALNIVAQAYTQAERSKK